MPLHYAWIEPTFSSLIKNKDLGFWDFFIVFLIFHFFKKREEKIRTSHVNDLWSTSSQQQSQVEDSGVSLSFLSFSQSDSMDDSPSIAFKTLNLSVKEEAVRKHYFIK